MPIRQPPLTPANMHTHMALPADAPGPRTRAPLPWLGLSASAPILVRSARRITPAHAARSSCSSSATLASTHLALSSSPDVRSVKLLTMGEYTLARCMLV